MKTRPVSPRAMIQRINRKMAPEGQILRTARSARGEGLSNEEINLGKYYKVDIRRNFVVDTHCDLVRLGKELNVMAKWESLAEE